MVNIKVAYGRIAVTALALLLIGASLFLLHTTVTQGGNAGSPPLLEQNNIYGPVDLSRGQSMRIRGFNVGEGPVIAHVVILNASNGNTLATFDQSVPPHHGFIFQHNQTDFEFSRAAQGDVDGSEMAGLSLIAFMHILPLIEQDSLVVSLQVVDPNGKTSLLVPAIQKVREAASR